MPAPLPLVRHFRALKDPRVKGRTTHTLETILVITLCAVISSAEDFQQIAAYGEERREWLKRFLDLSKGVPSHDTIERLFARLDPVVFSRCFTQWMNDWHERLTGKHLAIDGKAVRGSASPSAGLRCLHLVNVWATQANLCLGVIACDEDSNEITAIPHLLEMLELKGALVSLDAGCCQKKIAAQIVDQGGDYLLVVKANQGNLYRDIDACFEAAAEKDFEGVKDSYHEETDLGHGRKEHRVCVVIEDPEGISEQDKWKKLKVIGAMYSTREEIDGTTTFDKRYFIGSRRAKARFYGKSLRAHWKVENGLHWRLDVVFGEDDSRVRERTAATNLAVVRRLALNLLKQKEDDKKGSVAVKRFRAALNTDYLEEILEQ